jgi:hypothetical protein
VSASPLISCQPLRSSRVSLSAHPVSASPLISCQPLRSSRVRLSAHLVSAAPLISCQPLRSSRVSLRTLTCPTMSGNEPIRTTLWPRAASCRHVRARRPLGLRRQRRRRSFLLRDPGRPASADSAAAAGGLGALCEGAEAPLVCGLCTYTCMYDRAFTSGAYTCTWGYGARAPMRRRVEGEGSPCVRI